MVNAFRSLLADAASVALQSYVDGNCCNESKNNNNNSNSNNTSSSVEKRGNEDDAEEQLDDGANIPLSSCDGNKKSLFIGINYFGSSAELRGCINDVKNIKEFVTANFHFPSDSEHMRTLVDDQKSGHGIMPTKANMISSMKWLVQGAKSGDSLFLHYSGHGGSQKDTDNDEVDGNDETLIPVDYETAGVIVDDDLHTLLVASLPEGVRLTVIIDACHSGSVCDLPFTYQVDGNLAITEIDNRKQAVEAALQAGIHILRGDKKSALMQGIKAASLYCSKPNDTNEQARQRQVEIRSTVADVIQFSGCADHQTSADASIGGEATGAMSWSFRCAFEQHGFDQTYVELLGNIRKLLYGKYTQIPQMSTGHRMNMKTKFKM